MIAAVPHHGGATWAVLQYLLGFRELGHEVVFVEQVRRRRAARSRTHARRLHAVGGRALRPGGELGAAGGRHRAHGGPVLRRAASGRPRRGRADQHLGHPDRRGPAGRGAHAGLPRPRSGLQPALARAGHRHALRRPRPLRDGRAGDRHARVHRADVGIDWIPTVPPVVLDALAGARRRATHITTIGNWRGYGSVEHEGVHYGQKAHSMRDYMDLPRAPTRRSGSRSTSIPARRPTSRRSTATAGSSSTPADVAGDPGRLPASSSPGSQAELGHRQERLRAVALRLVQRSQRLLSRLRQAGGRAGHRLQPVPARPARACSRSRPRTTRWPAIERVRADYAAPRARRARDRRGALRLAPGAGAAAGAGRRA